VRARQAAQSWRHVTLVLTAMPPLVELSPDSKAACFKELDALQFTMEGLYARQ
jgi:hypothetical protein